MYLDFAVPIPQEIGKISHFKKNGTTYIRYVVGRTYHPDKKYNVPNHKIIGKLSADNSGLMIPNENFLKYFGDTELPELKRDNGRSSCLRFGTFVVLRRLIEQYHLTEMLTPYLGTKHTGLLLDLAAYSIICENNAAQYYPSYAYNHPLFTEKMHVYSDTKISTFLAGLTEDQRTWFLKEWNEKRDHREKIYISYDSTNKNSQAGSLELVEFGHAKDDKGLPVFNYAVAYDTYNREPLFYEAYSGSIVDVSQLRYMLDKAKGYGYRRVGFILDRGYFSKPNIRYLDEQGYDFVIMVKGMAQLVSSLILEVQGTFEKDRDCSIRSYKVYGTTVERELYNGDVNKRYLHIYYSRRKESIESEQVEARIDRMKKHLDKLKCKAHEVHSGYKDYFNLYFDKDGLFLSYSEKKEAIVRELSLCGYFVIVTSKKMTAREALELYKSRDTSEKVFRGDKSYLGNRSLRIQSDEVAEGKIFVEFIALILRNRLYTLLKEELEKDDQRPNYMTVPAAIRELEKLELIRGADGQYHMDHAVTKSQKAVLKAFRMDENYIRQAAGELSKLIDQADKVEARGNNDGETEEDTVD